MYVQMSDDNSIKGYFKDYPNKDYQKEVMDKANYGVLDDVVRQGAERLQDASQRGSGQNRDQVLREVVREVDNHYHAQNRQYNEAQNKGNRR